MNTNLITIKCTLSTLENLENYLIYIGPAKCTKIHPNKDFIVDNREEVINFLTTANFRRNCGGAKSIHAYDFSNLYTSIPHQKIKMNIRKFIL